MNFACNSCRSNKNKKKKKKKKNKKKKRELLGLGSVAGGLAGRDGRLT
jgi:hypothetical protein